MNTVHISVKAYNAEKTLRRTIESVLAQTYKNYKLYVCDNGSTDGTRAIVDEYAAKGEIIPFYNEKNHVWNEGSKPFAQLVTSIPADDFYAYLDADDEFFPDMLEELVKFALENDLDFASANYIMQNAETGESALGAPGITENMIFDTPEKYEKYYRNYALAFRQLWGKLYRANTAAQLRAFKTPVSPMISDTIFVLSALLSSKRAGVLNKPLMRYYVSRNSMANNYIESRKDFPDAIYNVVCNFIYQKAGRISSENYTYIYKYYCSEFREVLRIHLWVDLPIDTKLGEIEHLFSSEICRDLYGQVDYFDIFKNHNADFDLFKNPLEWIFENRETLPPERVLKIYFTFFDIVYQNKAEKFTEDEVTWLLSVSIPLANSVLCGVFENAFEVFGSLPNTLMKQSVEGKIRRLKG
ncbi:MAG: glycosyltransferase [Ruminococcus sp.]|jgi:glycosyltransferase involved in cell wall biosynthesis|nr:glycosyltransferase [Ruminococcus sp.]